MSLFCWQLELQSTMATSACLSYMVPPSSSSDHSFPHLSSSSIIPFPPHKPKLYKTLKLKPHNNYNNFTLSSLPLPLLCHSSPQFNHTHHELVEDPQEEELEEEQSDELEQESDEGKGEDNDGLDSPDDCRLYVGNLPYSMNSSQLAEIFAEAGHVRNVEVIYARVTDRSRGFGFLTMGSIDEAKEAIRMFDGSQVGGRTVRVNFPEVPRGAERKVMGPKIRSTNQSFVDSPHKIYAGNLGWGVTSQALGDAFAEQPGFLSAKVIYERDTGKSRGFGFISFSSAEAAESALQAMNGVEVEGRPLRLNVAAEKTRSNTYAYGEQSEVVSTVSS